jgi:hypothetical protein
LAELENTVAEAERSLEQLQRQQIDPFDEAPKDRGPGDRFDHAQERTMKRRPPAKRPFRTRKQVRNAFDLEEYGSEWMVGGGPIKLHPDVCIGEGARDRG